MSRAVMQQALDALVDVARDLATSQCAALYAALGDRSPHSHGAARRDLDQIESAIESLNASLAQPVAEPAGRVRSANCEYATVHWLKQTCDVGGGDPENARSWPISGEAVYLMPQPAPVAQPLTDVQWLKRRTALLGERLRRGTHDKEVATYLAWMRFAERTYKIGGPT